MHTLRASIVSILLLLAASSAQAMSITWNFQNAIFDDGTALTGSFDFDMGGSFWSPDAYSNVSLTTQDGVIGGEHYDDVTIASGSFGFVSGAGSFFSPQLLGIAFKDALSSAIGIIEIAGGMEMANLGSFFHPDIVSRELISGEVVSSAGANRAIGLPEPTALAIFLTGLIAVFALRRRVII